MVLILIYWLLFSLCCFVCRFLRFVYVFVFFFKQKTAYEMRISDWSSDVCSSDLHREVGRSVDAERDEPARDQRRPRAAPVALRGEDREDEQRGRIMDARDEAQSHQQPANANCHGPGGARRATSSHTAPINGASAIGSDSARGAKKISSNQIAVTNPAIAPCNRDNCSPSTVDAPTSTSDKAARVSRTSVRWNVVRSEEHTSELQSLMRNSYAVFCLKKNKLHN